MRSAAGSAQCLYWPGYTARWWCVLSGGGPPGTLWHDYRCTCCLHRYSCRISDRTPRWRISDPGQHTQREAWNQRGTKLLLTQITQYHLEKSEYSTIYDLHLLIRFFNNRKITYPYLTFAMQVVPNPGEVLMFSTMFWVILLWILSLYIRKTSQLLQFKNHGNTHM